MHKDQGKVHSPVERCSWRKLIHQPLLLDSLKTGGFFSWFFFYFACLFVCFLIDWLVIFFTSCKKLNQQCSVISQFRSCSCCPWDALLAHRLGLKSGLSLYFSLTEVSLRPHKVVSRRLLCSQVRFLMPSSAIQCMAGATAASLLPLILGCSPQPQLCLGQELPQLGLSELDDISKLLP